MKTRFDIDATLNQTERSLALLLFCDHVRFNRITAQFNRNMDNYPSLPALLWCNCILIIDVCLCFTCIFAVSDHHVNSYAQGDDLTRVDGRSVHANQNDLNEYPLKYHKTLCIVD